VLVESANVLKLGPCDESNAWNYTSAYELVLKHTGQCLEAKSVGDTAKLGTGCSKSCSKWQLISDSGMHVSAEVTKNGTRVCLEAGPDGVITTDECKCLTEIQPATLRASGSKLYQVVEAYQVRPLFCSCRLLDPGLQRQVHRGSDLKTHHACI
jgi:hypothetical protein